MRCNISEVQHQWCRRGGNCPPAPPPLSYTTDVVPRSLHSVTPSLNFLDQPLLHLSTVESRFLPSCAYCPHVHVSCPCAFLHSHFLPHVFRVLVFLRSHFLPHVFRVLVFFALIFSASRVVSLFFCAHIFCLTCFVSLRSRFLPSLVSGPCTFLSSHTYALVHSSPMIMLTLLTRFLHDQACVCNGMCASALMCHRASFITSSPQLFQLELHVHALYDESEPS